MSTAPLPPVGGRDPVTLPDGVPVVPTGTAPVRSSAVGSARPASRWLRFLEAVAGLLTAGIAVAGIVLLAAQLVAPRTGGTGLDAATGPGWSTVLATLAVAVVGESLRLLRRRLPAAARMVSAAAVIIGVLVLLWFSWWR